MDFSYSGGVDLDYWLQWQVAVCALIILVPTIGALVLIGRVKRAPLYASDLWMPSWRGLHPIWLLVYRALAFGFTSWLLYETANVFGAVVFLFYTQWTFTLVVVYFAFATIISAHGCWEYSKTPIKKNKEGTKQTAGSWGYLMQIIYQVSAGASMLTDIVFWGLLLPFQIDEQFTMTMLIASTHSVNLLCLLIDSALNRLQFPWFRMAYFVFWSSSYMTFQWILHMCCISWWPYIFLDLSTPSAPLWYLALALVHLICFGLYLWIEKTKSFIFSNLFPRAYVSSH